MLTVLSVHVVEVKAGIFAPLFQFDALLIDSTFSALVVCLIVLLQPVCEHWLAHDKCRVSFSTDLSCMPAAGRGWIVVALVLTSHSMPAISIGCQIGSTTPRDPCAREV